MKNCYAIGGRINLNETAISLCHGIDVGDCVIWEYGSDVSFDSDYYRHVVKELRRNNQLGNTMCNGCSNLISGDAPKDKLEIITINPMNYCQNRCVYCSSFQGEILEKYDPICIIENLIENDMVADNCLFDWGGGEPTLSPSFEKLFLYIQSLGYMQRINTNAIKLNEIVRSNLNKDLVSMRFSLDSGDAETFLRIKGRNLFDQVVENIKKYKKGTDNIVLKYVISCLNSDKSCTHRFVDLAKNIGIRTICVDAELNSFGWEEYNGLLRFTQKELDAAHDLCDYAKEQGLNVQVGYVWTAQNKSVPSRDFNSIQSIEELNESFEEYIIPRDLLPLHREKNSIYSKGIYADPISSIESLLHQMKGKHVVLYGAGKNGGRLLEVLRKNGLGVSGICDKEKGGQVLGEYKIISVEEMLSRIDEDTRIIITPFDGRSIVKEFNEKEYTKLRGRLYHIEAHRYSDRTMEEQGLCV